MIDLISDTVTKPTAGMLAYMVDAETGDDVFGEDPTVNAFERRVAGMFGKEAGLFVPSGTMSNQLCLNVLTSPGDEVILDELSHIFNYESGAGAALSGVQLRPLKGERGKINVRLAEAAIRPKNDWDPQTRAIALENTTNKGGGACYSLQEMKEIRELADRHGLYLHLDGARIWNALIAENLPAEETGSLFDTISVCFSKGLGAPAGSMMLASKKLIKKARRVRKMMGGGMRQVGLLAAAAEYALDNHYGLLPTDHFRAKKLAKTIAGTKSLKIEPATVQTNIVIFDAPGIPAKDTIKKFFDAGIRVSEFGPETIRLVFHFQVTDDDFTAVQNFIKNTF